MIMPYGRSFVSSKFVRENLQPLRACELKLFLESVH
jgi:hypothetical protein